MEATPIYTLPYPTSLDTDIGALDLQVLAEAADTQVSSVRAQYTALTRRPTAIWQSSVDQSAFSGITQGINFSTLVYSNATFTSTGQRNFLFPSSGLWQFGVMLNCVASGAITASSQRVLQIEADQPTGLKATDYTASFFGDQIFETSLAGGDFMTVTGVLNFQAVEGSIANRWISATFQNLNVGSSMTIKAGATIWMHRLSELDF